MRQWLERFRKNSATACRTRAETGASDFLDMTASVFACASVSHTTVRFMWSLVSIVLFPENHRAFVLKGSPESTRAGRTPGS
jgi:hypothetical protein